MALATLATHLALGVGLWPRPADDQAAAAHAALSGRFLAEIPPAAPVSASSALVPHLSHRAEVYVFPNVLDAQDVLVDLSGTPFPVDAAEQRGRLLALLHSGEFGVADAADGYVLLRRGAAERALPPAALGFTRGPASEATAVPLATFEGSLALVRAATGARSVLGLGRQEDMLLDWRLLAPLGTDARLVVWSGDRPATARPDFAEDLPALTWRPTSSWRAGEVVRLRVPPLGVSAGRGLTIGWLVPDTRGRQRPLACVDTAGRPCIFGTRFAVPAAPRIEW